MTEIFFFVDRPQNASGAYVSGGEGLGNWLVEAEKLIDIFRDTRNLFLTSILYLNQ